MTSSRRESRHSRSFASRVLRRSRRAAFAPRGFELLGTLHHLERVGLLARARDATAAGLVLGGGGARTPFAALRRALRLVVADVNSRQPSDAAYATPRREALAVFTQVAFNSWSAPRAGLPALRAYT